jgi:hypothetical protein
LQRQAGTAVDSQVLDRSWGTLLQTLHTLSQCTVYDDAAFQDVRSLAKFNDTYTALKMKNPDKVKKDSEDVMKASSAIKGYMVDHLREVILQMDSWCSDTTSNNDMCCKAPPPLLQELSKGVVKLECTG